MSKRITTVNLHTHTHRCKHARGIAADYATQTDPDFLTFGKVKGSAPTMLILR